MNTTLKNQQQNQLFEASFQDNSDSFNFELWASAVRHRMIASLQKKANEREARSNGKAMKRKLIID